jgi:hypothetical protein
MGQAIYLALKVGHMSGRFFRMVVIAMYFIVGIVIAWDHGYLTVAWLRALASVLLAVFLWWLILLGVNLHITA